MSNISLSYLCIKQKNNIKNYNNRTLKMEKKHYLIVTAAASALLLTTEAGVVDIKGEDPMGGMAGAGGMGGMGGGMGMGMM